MFFPRLNKDITSCVSSMCAILNPQIWQDFGAHSDWSKFEMERSDWSCAYCRLLSLKWQNFWALSDWSRAVSPPGSATGLILIGREQSRDL